MSKIANKHKSYLRLRCELIDQLQTLKKKSCLTYHQIGTKSKLGYGRTYRLMNNPSFDVRINDLQCLAKAFNVDFKIGIINTRNGKKTIITVK